MSADIQTRISVLRTQRKLEVTFISGLGIFNKITENFCSL